MNKIKEIFESFQDWWDTGVHASISKIVFIILLVIAGILISVFVPGSSTMVAGLIGGFLFSWMLFTWVMSKQK